tara:strand:- start:426 stop:932 length:507 start_codon:yes stop_codon:yes gene_type:complete
MSKIFHLNLFITILVGSLLSSCNGEKENFDVDLSNFKIPNKSLVKNLNTEIADSSKTKNKLIKNELINYRNKSEVLSSVLIGKKDPFSEEGLNLNNLTSDFKLKGFLNTQSNKYVFVSYLNTVGTISEDSIGGLNTNLLPNGAKVIKIDTKFLKLIINFENEKYTFKL